MTMKNYMDLPTFNFSFKTRTETLYQGEVTSVSASNELGLFDVLAEHTRTVAQIKGVVTVRVKEEIVFQTEVNNAVLWVGPEMVKILVL
jgi:F0F1-type ATP synthase epsilon subunit